MKRFIGLIAIVFVGIIAWRIGESLSSDAISMAVGVMFGVLAGVPTALLMLVNGRRQDAPESDRRRNHQNGGHQQLPNHQMGYPQQQSPVIVFAPSQAPQANGGYGYPAGYPAGHPGQQPQHQNGHHQGQPMLEAHPDPRYAQEAEQMPGQRHFKVVGEREEWVDGF